MQRRLSTPMRSTVGWPVTGEGLLANGSLARFYWRVLDELDYRVTQAQLWLADVVCGPEPETGADQCGSAVRGSDLAEVLGDIVRRAPGIEMTPC